jgi:large subunit ribosomal protein L20
MVRIKTNVYSHKRKKKILKEASGQWGDRSKRYKEAIKSLMSARQYSYYDRKKKKGEFRALWIIRLNAACRESGITYSRFINGLKNSNIVLDRKILSELAISDPQIFAQIIETAKNAKSSEVKKPKAVIDTTKKKVQIRNPKIKKPVTASAAPVAKTKTVKAKA